MGNKQDTIKRILDAALIEFGSNGYINASTNLIASRANVSKGVIFKYFHHKHELYYQVFVDELSKMLDGLNSYMSNHPCNDVFNKIVDVILWKASYASSNPYASALMLEAISKPPANIKSLIMNHIQELSALSIHTFFNQIPMDQIQDHYTLADVQKTIGIAVNGLQATYVKEGMTLEYLDSIREESIQFLKTVLRGMEK